MSKASEWAASRQAAETEYRRLDVERIEWLCPEGGCHMKVKASGDGVLHVSDNNHVTLSPASAVSLARWILDTFGEDAGMSACGCRAEMVATWADAPPGRTHSLEPRITYCPTHEAAFRLMAAVTAVRNKTSVWPQDRASDVLREIAAIAGEALK